MTDKPRLLRCFIVAFIRRACLLPLLVLSFLDSSAQKYSFRHYDVEDGLIESQVNQLASDSRHRLRMATNGGAALFDGNTFVSYSRQNGMHTNFVNKVLVDKHGAVWFATQNGLMELDSNRLKDITALMTNPVKHVQDVVQSAGGVVWFLMNHRLCQVTPSGAAMRSKGDTVTAIASSQSGELYCTVYRKGLYRLEGSRWSIVAPFAATERNADVTQLIFDRNAARKIYLLSKNNVYVAFNGEIEPFSRSFFPNIGGPFYSFGQDSKGNFWLGPANGAYRLSGGALIHFTAAFGYSNNPVTDIYNDADNNLWLATQGNGLFKFQGGRVLLFDKTQGLPDREVVMCIAKAGNGHILFGVYDGGLMEYDGRKVSRFLLPGHKQIASVQCIYTDSGGTVWIGTDKGGLWTNRPNAGLLLVKGTEAFAINAITNDDRGAMLISTDKGGYFLDKGGLTPLTGFRGFVHSMTPIGRDSVVVATQDGVRLAFKGKVDPAFHFEELSSSAIFSVLHYGHMLYLGTDDRGIFAWNLANGRLKNITGRNGLNSNTIYSLAHADDQVIWAGTGRGVNRLTPRPGAGFRVENAADAKNEMIESNENAILYADHKIWVGTTKGLVAYADRTADASAPPHIFIQSVQLISQAPGGYEQK